MNKPIDPSTHAALDYGLSMMQIVGPKVLRLNAPARAISSMFGTIFGATTAITDTPLGVKRILPFNVHGAMELPSIAAMAAVPWLAGAMDSPRARAFFLGCIGMAVTNFMLTDFSANEQFTEQEDLRLADVASAAPESLEPLLRT
jgi:hypothetical protein